MHPELFEIPVVHLTIRGFGLMMVVGFLAAIAVIRHLSRPFTRDPQHITNGALYALIAGVVGARVFFVVHYFEQYRDEPLSVFAIWNGGLELYGGALPAIAVILLYVRYHKLPIRHYLDVVAMGLMLTLMFGRLGCFLNGCCYGRPTQLPWGVRFPYGSFAYRNQVRSDPDRARVRPHLELPDEYFGYTNEEGRYVADLKPWKDLTPRQKELVTTGPYRCLRVHPTELYSSAAGALLGLVLYGVWRRSRRAERAERYRFLTRPGSTFSLALILYGVMRFLMEMLRDDNPFEIDSLTISQLICIGLVAAGIGLTAFFTRRAPEKLPSSCP
jgi:phosphatidylglycerol:prolipoprotein diacylglycerol transferase